MPAAQDIRIFDEFKPVPFAISQAVFILVGKIKIKPGYILSADFSLDLIVKEFSVISEVSQKMPFTAVTVSNFSHVFS